jgi:hypothetical protein
MDSIVKVKRVFRNEANELTNRPGEKKSSKAIIDLRTVSDYEEYKGDLAEDGKLYTLVLVEFQMVSEYKIIEEDFERFHDTYCKFRKYIEIKEGIIKHN